MGAEIYTLRIRGAPHLPVCCNKRPPLVQRGEEASRGQVCSSCSYLWANTGCLFSLGKYRLLYKCTHRSDCRSDLTCSQNDTSHWFCCMCSSWWFRLLEDVPTTGRHNNITISSITQTLFNHHISCRNVWVLVLWCTFCIWHIWVFISI